MSVVCGSVSGAETTRQTARDAEDTLHKLQSVFAKRSEWCLG
jgi:hypothetical protein